MRRSSVRLKIWVEIYSQVNFIKSNASSLQEKRKCKISTCEKFCDDGMLEKFVDYQKKPFMPLYNSYLNECSKSLVGASECERNEASKYCSVAKEELSPETSKRSARNSKEKSLQERVEEFKKNIKIIKRQYLRRLKDLETEKAKFASSLDQIRNDCQKQDVCELPVDLTPPLLIGQSASGIISNQNLYEGVLEKYSCKKEQPPTPAPTPSPTPESKACKLEKKTNEEAGFILGGYAAGTQCTLEDLKQFGCTPQNYNNNLYTYKTNNGYCCVSYGGAFGDSYMSCVVKAE